MRSVAHRLIGIGRASRGRGRDFQQKQKTAYRKLMSAARKVVAQALTLVDEVRRGIKKAAAGKGSSLWICWLVELKDVSALTNWVLEQTKARVSQGNTHFKGKLFSIFGTATEAIRKGKAAKPTEFGKMVKVQEAENQIAG